MNPRGAGAGEPSHGAGNRKGRSGNLRIPSYTFFCIGPYRSASVRKCSNGPEIGFPRLRHEYPHNFEKNLDQNGLLRTKLEHFEIGQPRILRSKNFENCRRHFHWKSSLKKKTFFDFIFNFHSIFTEHFSMKIFGFPIFLISKFLVDRFQNVPTFFVIIRFRRDFFKSCVDFHGGDDGIEIRAI